MILDGLDGDIDNILSGLCERPKRANMTIVDDDRCKPLIIDGVLTDALIKKKLSQGNKLLLFVSVFVN